MVRRTGLEGFRIFFQWSAQRVWRGFVFQWSAQRVWRGFVFQWSAQRARKDSFLSTGSPNGSGRVSDFIFNGLPNGPGGDSFLSTGSPNGSAGLGSGLFKYWLAQRAWEGFGFQVLVCPKCPAFFWLSTGLPNGS